MGERGHDRCNINGLCERRARCFCNIRLFFAGQSQSCELSAGPKSDRAQSGDLVIAHARTVDDLCGWVPLLTPATVLFCRSAQDVLTHEQNHTLYRERQAFYLYFLGRDGHWIEEVTADKRANETINLGLYTDTATNVESTQRQSVTSIKGELIPLAPPQKIWHGAKDL